MFLTEEHTDTYVKKGDTVSHNISIDKDNMDFIMTLLSSNLYSKPEESFIREIVCNAWDSHVEAGNTDTPVLVKLNYKNTYKGDVTIRDYGTGISPERFNEIYCCLGSSTKRDSNEYIGAFGIGRFSALACSNIVYISSYYEGKQYCYVMNKANNKISIEEVFTIDTDQHNGVEISVSDVDLCSCEAGLQQVVHIPNLYVEGGKTIDFSKVRTRIGKYYSVCSFNSIYNILIGNVGYSCSFDEIREIAKDILNDKNRDLFNFIFNYGPIAIKFDIGELSVTPNRENIIWSERSKETFKNKLKYALDEILDRIDEINVPVQASTLKNAYILSEESRYFDPLENAIKSDLTGYHKYKISSQEVTYSGKKLDSIELKLINKLNNFYIKNLYRINSAHNPSIRLSNLTALGKCEYFFNGSLTTTSRKFFIEKYPDSYICNINEIKTIKDYMYSFEDISSKLGKDNIDKYIDIYLKENIKETIDLKTDDSYKEFKKNNRKKSVPLDKEEIYIYYFYSIYGYRSRDKMTKASFLRSLSRTKGPIYILDNLEGMNYVAKLCLALGITVISANANTVKWLKSLDDRHFISEKKVMNNKKLIAYITFLKFYTLNKITDSFSLNFMYKYGNFRIKELKDRLNEKNRLINSFKRNARDTSLSFIDFNLHKIDEQFYNDLQIAHNLYKKNNEIDNMFDVNTDNVIIMYAIMKNKLFRISYEEYARIKQSKTISILCGKL